MFLPLWFKLSKLLLIADGRLKGSFVFVFTKYQKNYNAVMVIKHNIMFNLVAWTAFHKRQTDPLTNLLFSPLLFVLVFFFVFLPVLVWAAVAVLQLLFVFVFLLRVVLMFAGTQRGHRGQKSSARGRTLSRCTGIKEVTDKSTKHQQYKLKHFWLTMTASWTDVNKNCQKCAPPNILQPTSISTTQKENMTTVPQWFKLLMRCRCHS